MEEKEPTSRYGYLHLLSKHPKKIGTFLIIIWILLLVYGYPAFNGLDDGGFIPPSSESVITNGYFTQRFVSPNPDINILLSHPVWTVDMPEYKAAFEEFKGNITTKLPVYAVLSYFDYPDAVTDISADRTNVKVTARTLDDPNITLEQYQSTTVGNPLSFEFAGADLANLAVNDAVSTDLKTIEFGALPVLVVVLVFVFEGIVAMFYPIALALWTLACVLALLRVTSTGFHVSTFTIDATTIFGIGLALDFALFTHIRFKVTSDLVSCEDNRVSRKSISDIMATYLKRLIVLFTPPDAPYFSLPVLSSFAFLELCSFTSIT